MLKLAAQSRGTSTPIIGEYGLGVKWQKLGALGQPQRDSKSSRYGELYGQGAHGALSLRQGNLTDALLPESAM